MKTSIVNQENTCTAFIRLDSYNCTACWKCTEACPNDVIDKSFLFIGNTLVHEQVIISDPEKCAGCLKCKQACEFDAINFISNNT